MKGLNEIELKPEQLKLLQLLSDGQTQKAIASQMGMSRRNVQKMLSKVRKLYSCENNEQLTKLCTQAGHLV